MKIEIFYKYMVFFAVLIIAPVLAQDEEWDDFDPSQFQEAGETLVPFCTNKVMGQSPSPLISFGFDIQGAATVSSPAVGTAPAENAEWGYSPGFRFISNVPVISKNNILVNWNVNYVQMGYRSSQDIQYANPLNNNLSNYSLKWANTNLTVFKPLNEKRWILAQVGVELNGDYNFNNLPSFSNARFPLALLYGFKLNDNFMWGFGAVQTYLGGSLNYLPVLYYYQTFKNEHWGVEMLLPSRAYLRYRADSRNLFLFGFNVEGATYRLSNFNAQENFNPLDNTELRRSEIRAGLTYQRGFNDFIYVSAQAGYRINYIFSVDQGNERVGFDDSPYFMDSGLTNTWFGQITLSLVSP